MSHTKESLAQEFNLSLEDVQETLKAIGFHPNKKKFSDQDKERFAQARRLLSEGAANSYEDLQSHFRPSPGSETGMPASDVLAELQRQGVEASFELGLKQGEMMGKVIPHAAVMRLKEMIATGELKDNFESYWKQAMAGGNSPESVEALVEEQWTAYQLNKYPTPASLPESSTPSSEND